jgi:hypothetical protein
MFCTTCQNFKLRTHNIDIKCRQTSSRLNCVISQNIILNRNIIICHRIIRPTETCHRYYKTLPSLQKYSLCAAVWTNTLTTNVLKARLGARRKNCNTESKQTSHASNKVTPLKTTRGKIATQTSQGWESVSETEGKAELNIHMRTKTVRNSNSHELTDRRTAKYGLDSNAKAVRQVRVPVSTTK